MSNLTPGSDGYKTAKEIEQLTGIPNLRGREVVHMSKNGLGLITPEDPCMRFQLGKVETEKKSHEPIEGVMLRLEETDCPIFTLLAWGASWEAAAARYRAKYPGNGTAPAETIPAGVPVAYNPATEALFVGSTAEAITQ